MNVHSRDSLITNWCCSACKKKGIKENRPALSRNESMLNTARPTKAPAEISSNQSVGKATPEAERDDLANCMQSHVSGTDFQLLMDELKAVKVEIQSFRKDMEMEMTALRASMHSCNSRLDCLEARISAVEERAVPSNNSSNVEAVIENLKRELNDRD